MDRKRTIRFTQNGELTEEESIALDESINLKKFEDFDEFEDFITDDMLNEQLDLAVASLAVDPPKNLVSGTMWKIAPEVMEKRTGKKAHRRFPFMGTAIAAVAAAALVVIGINNLNFSDATESASVADGAMNAQSIVATEALNENQAEYEPQDTAVAAEMFGIAPGYYSYTEDPVSLNAPEEAAPAESQAMAETEAGIDVPERGILHAAPMPSAVALLVAQSEAEIALLGEPILEEAPVYDPVAWAESIFGSGIFAENQFAPGTYRMRLYAPDADLEELTADFPELSVVDSGAADGSCTIIVAEVIE